MPKDSKILDVSERAATLKKAGFSTAVTLVIILLSTPGFYNFFFDTKGEEARIEAVRAQAASEISYALLKDKTEHMEEQLTTLRGDVKELAVFIREMTLQQAQVNAGARLGGHRATAANAPEAPTMPIIAPLTKSSKLPENLDPLIQVQLKEDLVE